VLRSKFGLEGRNEGWVVPGGVFGPNMGRRDATEGKAQRDIASKAAHQSDKFEIVLPEASP
jgi:hypothetical protein